MIELSKIGMIVNAFAPFVAATMLRLPLAPPKPPANIRYVVPAVPVKRTLARLPVQIGPLPSPQPVTITPGPSIRGELQRVMTRDAGVLRSATSLERAADALAALTPSDIESANLLAVSSVLVRAGTARRESRGTHTREDFPTPSASFLGRLVFTGAPAPEFVPLATEHEPSR